MVGLDRRQARFRWEVRRHSGAWAFEMARLLLGNESKEKGHKTRQRLRWLFAVWRAASASGQKWRPQKEDDQFCLRQQQSTVGWPRFNSASSFGLLFAQGVCAQWSQSSFLNALRTRNLKAFSRQLAWQQSRTDPLPARLTEGRAGKEPFFFF